MTRTGILSAPSLEPRATDDDQSVLWGTEYDADAAADSYADANACSDAGLSYELPELHDGVRTDPSSD